MNPFSYTEKRVWVEENIGFSFIKNLIFCNDKSLMIGDYLIDDNCEGKGQENFKGTLIHYGSENFSSWNDIFVYLITGN